MHRIQYSKRGKMKRSKGRVSDLEDRRRTFSFRQEILLLARPLGRSYLIGEGEIISFPNPERNAHKTWATAIVSFEGAVVSRAGF